MVNFEKVAEANRTGFYTCKYFVFKNFEDTFNI